MEVAGESKGTVLVTGGSGFLGGWCLVELLRQGYEVRTTVRDLAREAEVRAKIEAAVPAAGRLAVQAADLTADEGWTEAVAGCRYVLHVASPFPPVQPKDPDELIVPAREGALRVLRAALDAGVERVVLTSSVAAVRGKVSESAVPLTEVDWTDGDNPAMTPYTRSKTLTERAAWELVGERGERSRLAVVNPGAILGPLLGADTSFSLEMVERLLKGLPGTPRIGFSVVDVRDVADLHVRAMEQAAAGGGRYIATDRFMWMADVGGVLKDRLGEDARKVPTRVAPNFMIKAIGLFDPSVRSIVGDLGQHPEYSNARAREELGWSPRPLEDSIADTGRSLIEFGVVKV